MLRRWLSLFIWVGFFAQTSLADTIHLKEKATITGKVLAEKKDQIAVDVGYTILLIPRSEILEVLKLESPPAEIATQQTQPADSSETTAADSETGPLYTGPGKSAAAGTVRDLVQHLGEAVVQVRTPASIGSGFIINEEGFLITNFHVIEGESQISVEVYHQNAGQLEPTSYKQVRIIAMNKFADLALLRIQDRGAPKFKKVVLGSSDLMAVGERVFAIGSPMGLERTVTEGILSTKTRQMAGELYLQTTTQINPGNSGGPLFNMNGEVVGVTNMKMTFGEGLGFAIPVEGVKFFLNHRDAYTYSNENPGTAYRYLAPPSRVKHTQTVE